MATKRPERERPSSGQRDCFPSPLISGSCVKRSTSAWSVADMAAAQADVGFLDLSVGKTKVRCFGAMGCAPPEEGANCSGIAGRCRDRQGKGAEAQVH